MSNGHHPNGDVLSDSSSASSSAQSHTQRHNSFDIGGGALDEARLQYKSSVAALRSVLIALSNAQKVCFGFSFHRFCVLLWYFQFFFFFTCIIIFCAWESFPLKSSYASLALIRSCYTNNGP